MDECLPVLLTPLTTPMINFVLKLFHLMPNLVVLVYKNLAFLACIQTADLDASTMDGTIGINNANKRDIHHFNTTGS